MNGCDLLSVFLESPEIFDDDAIAQNILGLIFAASETTHFASQTLISMMTQRKDILAKLREEFEESVLKPALRSLLTPHAVALDLPKVFKPPAKPGVPSHCCCRHREHTNCKYGRNLLILHNIKLVFSLEACE